MDNCTIKILNEDDIKYIQNLCEQCADYYLLDNDCIAGENEARNILDALPPNKTFDDQYNFGLFDENHEMIGLVNIIDGYPEENIWMLGLMLISPKQRKKGVGKYFHQEMIQFAKSKDGKEIRVAVLEDNKNALEFWQSQGYKFIKESSSDRGNNKIKKIHVFALEI